MPFFELGEMARVLEMPLTKAKNWTNGRPLWITPSIKAASGYGSRKLYSEDDLYLMAVADALSKSGMAANAIKLLLDALPTDWRKAEVLVAWRPGQWLAPKPEEQTVAQRLAYRVERAGGELPPEVQTWQQINVSAIIGWVNERRKPKGLA